MHLAHYALDELKQQIVNILRKYLDLNQYKVFFFGSRVAGTGDERSDIDVGIEGEVPIPSSTMAQIKEEIEELPTLYTVQIVDFATVSPSFKEIALETTEIIYPYE